MTTVVENKITAIDLSKVVLLNSQYTEHKHSVLNKHDLEFQENRRKRKVKKIYFEER